MLNFPGMVSLLLILCSLNLVSCERSSSTVWYQQKTNHEAANLGNKELAYVAGLSNMQQFDVILDPILVPRVVGTQNHKIVKQYLKDQMKQLGWDLESDRFSENTPLGKKTFENIIATLNPQSTRRLVLACHYDSKYTRSGNFVGATDSAVPCAMMIDLAKVLAAQLNQHKISGDNVTLQFIFFDGEEAFKTWTARDSIYGARHLAAKLASTRYPEDSNGNTNHLHRMDLFVLLDLLGTSNPTFRNYIHSGDRWYRHIANVEQRLREKGFISNQRSYFSFDSGFGGIEDDHVPFMKRGVPILHLIPSPFPSIWHTDDDNKSALDYPTIDNLNKILRVFVAEYLGLSIA